MKPVLLIASLTAMTLALGGCASSLTGDTYSRAEARTVQTVRMGSIVTLRPVRIEGTKTAVGAGAGSIAGGIAGSSVGGGRGSAVAAVVGAVAGGLAGKGIAEAIDPTAEELAQAKTQRTVTLPGQWETASAVASSIGQIVRFGFPDRYFDDYPARVKGLSLGEVAEATRFIDPDHLSWVVVGDRARVEKGLQDLGLGAPVLLDAEGNPAK